MKILGIVGSLHKDGLTDELVKRVVEGSQSAGAETEIVYLADYNIKQWSDGDGGPKELDKIVNNADAYVLGAPVYYLDVNGLTKDFMDTIDLQTDPPSSTSGKPALGIAVAGGTGKGLTSALKSIYYFFLCKGLRGIEPLPVSRFNYKNAKNRAYELGDLMTRTGRHPFHNLAERISHYFSLQYMNYDIVDEILLLTEQLIETSRNKRNLETAKIHYEKAKDLIEKGKKRESVHHAVNAYEILYY